MGTITKDQRFPYSFKTVAAVDRNTLSFTTLGTLTGNFLGIEVINPTNFYACEGLYAHIRFVHDGLSAGRNVTRIVVTDDNISPTFYRQVNVSRSASGLTLDARVDFTALKNTSGRNLCFFDFDAAVTGTLKLLKLDMLYQVVGIR